MGLYKSHIGVVAPMMMNKKSRYHWILKHFILLKYLGSWSAKKLNKKQKQTLRDLAKLMGLNKSVNVSIWAQLILKIHNKNFKSEIFLIKILDILDRKLIYSVSEIGLIKEEKISYSFIKLKKYHAQSWKFTVAK